MGQGGRNTRKRTAQAVAAAAFAAAAGLGALAIQSPGSAFPGSNGRILFTAGDGDGIQCSSLPRSESYNLYAVNADGSNLVRIVTAAPQHTIFDPAATADGSRVAFADFSCEGAELRVTDLSGGASRTIRSGSTQETMPRDPFWSPDGNRLGFSAGGDLWVGDDEGDATRIADQGADQCGGGAWSPDGSQIVMHCFTTDGQSQIYVMDPDGANRTAIGEGYEPAWSPDGERLAFIDETSEGQGSSAYAMDPDGNNRVPLFEGAISVSWAPDGSRVVLATGSSEQPLRLVDPDGSGAVDVPNVPDAYVPYVDWAPAAGTAPTTTTAAGGSTTSTTAGTGSTTSTTTAAATTTTSTTTMDDEPAPVDQTPNGSPRQVAPGDSITVEGTGFAAGSEGAVFFDDEIVGRFIADAQGKAVVTFRIPADADDGPHEVFLEGVDGADRDRAVLVRVQVAERRTATLPRTDDGRTTSGAAGAGGSASGLPVTGTTYALASVALGALLVVAGSTALQARKRR